MQLGSVRDVIVDSVDSRPGRSTSLVVLKASVPLASRGEVEQVCDLMVREGDFVRVRKGVFAPTWL